jgi:hypothetical protein
VFAYYSSNIDSTSINTTPGSSFTTGNTDVDGTAVSCVSALAHDGHLVSLTVDNVAVSGQQVNAVGDLLIDPAGGTSWSVLISDLCCGYTHATNNILSPVFYTFPLWVPAGASLGWRAKTNYTSDVTTGTVFIGVHGEPSRPEMWWCGSGVETLGVSDSKGTVITPGASSAWGSWTSVGSTTSRLIRSIQLGINGTDTGTSVAKGYHLEVGANSTRLPGVSRYYHIPNASESTYRTPTIHNYCSVPAGTQLQVRAMHQSTGPINNLVALYGVY